MNLIALVGYSRDAIVNSPSAVTTAMVSGRLPVGSGVGTKSRGLVCGWIGAGFEEIGRRRPRIPRLVERGSQELEGAAGGAPIDAAAQRRAVGGSAPDVIRVAVEQIRIAVVERLFSNQRIGNVLGRRTMRSELPSNEIEQSLGRRQWNWRGDRRGRPRCRVRGLNRDSEADQGDRGNERGFHGQSALTGRHSDRAVEAYHFAIEHLVLRDMPR